PVIYNFGDSNSDTGALLADLDFSINPPNSRTFFGTSVGHLSDGALYSTSSIRLSIIPPLI
ncbi:hypothetical protein LINPERPRIM_LOCUS32526, partial [Linum perenne]